MRVRHKIPSVFSLSMVDVLCCALGCVILVWLLNARQSQEESNERQGESDALLSSARAEREESDRLLKAARADFSQSTSRISALLSEREKGASLVGQLEQRIGELDKSRTLLTRQLDDERRLSREWNGKWQASQQRVAVLQGDIRTATARLEDERRRSTGLDRSLSEKESLVAGLRTDLATLQQRLEEQRERARGLDKTIEQKQADLAGVGKMLAETRAARERLEKTLGQRDKDLASALVYRDRYEAETKRSARLEQDLEKEKQAALASAKALLARLEKEKETAVGAVNARLVSLEKEKEKLRQAVDHRFAGISLGGKRVIFLVDCSGSMEMLDDKTTAPQKWREVCETVAKLMRSLPDLERFQIIAFGPKFAYPLGQQGKWLAYDAKSSPQEALKALLAIMPSGGTNMYAALDSAFGYRSMGLDTIYFLSDGLPNQGDHGSSVKVADFKKMTPLEKGIVLGKHVRGKLQTDWNKATPARAKVKIHTIGFFYESPDLGSFLWALARENDGSFVGMSTP